MTISRKRPASEHSDSISSLEAARVLHLATGTVQRLFDAGDLQGWKTKGGHRRILRSSVEAYLQKISLQLPRTYASELGAQVVQPDSAGASVLVIEDSSHYRNLISRLLRDQFPAFRVDLAADGVTGLLKLGEKKPDILIIDIMLPGMDGTAVLGAMRDNPFLSHTKVIAVTGLREAELAPFRHALVGVTLIHKESLVAELSEKVAALIDKTAD